MTRVIGINLEFHLIAKSTHTQEEGICTGKSSLERKWPKRLYRAVPKNMMNDKEALYDNTLKVRQYANDLIKENLKLKVKLQQVEDALSRKEKLLNSFMSQMSNISGMQGIQRLQKEVTLLFNFLDTSYKCIETAIKEY